MDVQPLVDALRERSIAREDLDPALVPLVDEALAAGLVFVDCRNRLTTAA